MTEPTTPTGKRLDAWLLDDEDWLRDDILAIEAEARKQERERLLPLIEAVRAYMDAPQKGPTSITERHARRVALSEALVKLWKDPSDD